MTAAARKPRRTEPPPGPPGELSLMEIRSDPLAFLSRLTTTYGDIVRYSTPGWTAVIVNRPDFIRHILVDAFRNYTKVGTPDLLMLRPMLGDGLLTSDGDAWKQQRQMLQPVFTHRSVEQYAGFMTHATSQMLAEWAVVHPTEIDVVPAMTELTLRIAARALFSYDVGDSSNRFGKAVEVLNETVGHPDPSGADTRERFHGALDVVRQTVHNVVSARLHETEARRDDALGLMIQRMGLDDAAAIHSDALADQMLTLLLAGHETTAKALAWTLYLLSLHPDAAERIRGEAEDVIGLRDPEPQDLHRMPFTWAVLQESMRLYPPIWLMSRRAAEADIIGGYAVEAGTLVVFSPYLIHRRDDLWPEPTSFRPERFLERVQTVDSDDYSFLPFSNGPRHCVGKQFAGLEMRLVLPMILRRVTLELRAGHPVEPQTLVTLRPKFGLPMHVRPLPMQQPPQ